MTFEVENPHECDERHGERRRLTGQVRQAQAQADREAGREGRWTKDGPQGDEQAEDRDDVHQRPGIPALDGHEEVGAPEPEENSECHPQAPPDAESAGEAPHERDVQGPEGHAKRALIRGKAPEGDEGKQQE
ncbi:hypothetical protein D3C86_747840 [compost metagenome]